MTPGAYNNHRTAFYHIFWHKGEENVHYIKNKKINLKHNSLLIIPPDIIHRFSLLKRNRGDVVLFSLTAFADTQDKHDFMTHCALFRNDYIIISPGSETFAFMVDSYFSLMRLFDGKEKGEAERTMLRNWLHNFLITIDREYRLQKTKSTPVIFTSSPDYMRQFKMLLDTHYKTQKYVHYYAESMNLSEKKLSQVVSSIHGITAKRYITEKILYEALLLVRNTTMNQSEIADELGLDFTYFVKLFRKQFGTTPAKYRREREHK
jgi:AraC-like DNA-binding protein/cupin superfamily acireductone dioxygenase involved in methionine salvage